MDARKKIGRVSVLLLIGLLAILTTLVSAYTAEPSNFDEWVKVLADGKADTLKRMDAAKRLGEAKVPKSLDALAQALKDGTKSVRWAAVEALWDMGDKRAVPFLIEYLIKGEAYQWGKILTMNALGSMKDPQAVEPLLNTLENENPFLRRSAALNLVRIGDERAIPGLIKLLKDDVGWLQRLAQQLLLELTAKKIQGEPPRGYEAWVQWYNGEAQRVKIEGVKKE